jgi:hypothetical protein
MHLDARMAVIQETNLRLDYVLDIMGVPVQLGTNEHLIYGSTKGARRTTGAPGSDAEGSKGRGGSPGGLIQGQDGKVSKKARLVSRPPLNPFWTVAKILFDDVEDCDYLRLSRLY